jgi:uncharacterized protein YutE (UPF0331/DUF86 family)
MSPEVIARKLSTLSKYIQDLLPYQDCTFQGFLNDHYKIERLIELLVMTASDIVFHLLSMRSEPPPGSYRAAFLRASEIGLLNGDLSKSLALGAGLRNILVHEYEEVDYKLLHESIPVILKDMTAFVSEVSKLI